MGHGTEVATSTETRVYTGIQAGGIATQSGGTIPATNLIFGGEVEKGNTYGKAEVGAGTSFTLMAEAGRRYDIGNNMGLELSVGALAARSNSSESVSLSKAKFNLTDILPLSEILPGEGEGIIPPPSFNKTYTANPVELRAAIGAQFTYKPCSNVKLGAGIEAVAGYGTSALLNHTGAYVRPKISANIKSGKFEFFGNTKIREGNIGVKYTL